MSLSDTLSMAVRPSTMRPGGTCGAPQTSIPCLPCSTWCQARGAWIVQNIPFSTVACAAALFRAAAQAAMEKGMFQTPYILLHSNLAGGTTEYMLVSFQPVGMAVGRSSNRHRN